MVDAAAPEHHASVRLPAASFAPRDARRFVAAVLRDWQFDQAADAATLLTSELVTNAIVHAGTDVRVVLETREGILRVEVIDLDARLPVRRFSAYDDLTTGRGLTLLDGLARDWGVQRRTDGKAVWFELPTG